MPMENDKNYRPSDREPFMNERQREYFRNKLLAWKEEILRGAQETLQYLQDESQNHADFTDRASSETERAIELRARARERKLIAKIDAALQCILCPLSAGPSAGFLPKTRRADLATATRSAPHRDLVHRGPRAPRTARTRSP